MSDEGAIDYSQPCDGCRREWPAGQLRAYLAAIPTVDGDNDEVWMRLCPDCYDDDEEQSQ